MKKITIELNEDQVDHLLDAMWRKDQDTYGTPKQLKIYDKIRNPIYEQLKASKKSFEKINIDFQI